MSIKTSSPPKIRKPFEFAHDRSQQLKDDKFETEPIGFFQDAMLRFVKNKASIVAFWLIAFIVLMSFIGPYMNEYGYKDQNVTINYMPARVPGLERLGVFDG